MRPITGSIYKQSHSTITLHAIKKKKKNYNSKQSVVFFITTLSNQGDFCFILPKK